MKSGGIAWGLAFAIGVVAWAAPAHGQEKEAAATATPDPAPPPLSQTVLDRMRAEVTAGKFKEIEFAGDKVRIPDPAELTASERPVKAAASLAPVTPTMGLLDRGLFEVELGDRLRDLDACRALAPRSEGVNRQESDAGLVVLRWTIQPDGRARNTGVYQQRATSIDMMKCMRKRMESWRFTPPVGGPVSVERTVRVLAARGEGTAPVVRATEVRAR